ncbi:MAG: hypothetical protein ACD_8C00134G0003 [uncultured bacterium]|nr:MAG: hypothetical protein ACD_8C00134G0003 [uncultured bacterium]
MTEENKEIKDASMEEESNLEIETEEEKEVEPETEEEKKDKKIKNLVSAVILLAGLFVGSLFVDGIQMVRGGGFSQRALKTVDVFALNGRTWVAYDEPLVKLQVISDDSCEACKPDEVLVGLKGVLPTMLNEKIDYNSEQGQKLIAQFGIKTLPAFIFSKEIEKTELFVKAESFLSKQGDSYAIKSAEAGFPVGKYVSAPTIEGNDVKIGSDESLVKVISFINFMNPSDKSAFQTITSQITKDYADKVQVVFKGYVPATATQGVSAFMASACANEQGKFLEYGDKLFATQAVWAKAKDATPALKGYAANLKLNTADFNKCLDDKKYQELTTKTLTEGQAFGIQATPSIFVGTDLQAPTVKYDDVKKVIEQQLSR